MMNYLGPVRAASEAEAARMQAAAALLDAAKTSFEEGDLNASLADVDLALTFVPNSPHAHWNRGQVLLALGQYQEGFREFEWRSHLWGNPAHEITAPRWDGESLDRKHLLLVHEHGYGDGLMMLRYVPLLKAKGARITLVVPPALTRLMQRLDVAVFDNWPNAAFDYYCPIFSLMIVLDHQAKDIPAAAYLPTRFSECSGIGLAWSGNPEHANDRWRSMRREQLAAALGLNEYCSVQENTYDFAHTADLMARLKHIVTVDTAAVHLAGAIGHPSVHLLLPHVPDWRWRNGAPWYPTFNIYRQTVAGDWSDPLDRVRRAIA